MRTEAYLEKLWKENQAEFRTRFPRFVEHFQQREWANESDNLVRDLAWAMEEEKRIIVEKRADLLLRSILSDTEYESLMKEHKIDVQADNKVITILENAQIVVKEKGKQY